MKREAARRSGVRVLYVVPTYYPAHFYGGPIQSVHALCRGLSRLGCDVRVLTTDAAGPQRNLEVPHGREVTLEDGVRVRYCRRRAAVSASGELLTALPGYLRWAEVVHLTAVYSFPTIPVLAAARWAGKPLVWSPRGSLDPWPGRSKPLLKKVWETVCRLLRPRDAVFHVTSAQEERSSGARFPGIPCAVIPNGVEAPRRLPEKSKAETLRILYLGRLDRKKAIENLVSACARLDRSGLPSGAACEWRLQIAGTGDRAYERQIRRLTADLGLASKVDLLGEVIGSAREQIFRNSDLLVCCSHAENFGMVVAEALSRELPVITSRGTPWERVEERGCGLWVSNDPASLADAIRRASRMPLEEMGRRGRAWMQQEFDWDTRARQMLAVYRERLERFGEKREEARAGAV